MDRLKVFYRNCMKISVTIIGALGIFIGKEVISFIDSAQSKSFWTSVIVKILTSSGFFAILYYFFEYIVRQHLWRYINRDIDFSGEWLGWTFYTNLEIESGEEMRKDFKDFNHPHKVIIEQNCLNIKIIPSPGAEYVKWGSIAINITENKELNYAYEVTYDGKGRLKDKALGYEEMDIIKTVSKCDKLPKIRKYDKLPILMSGIFYHCATGRKPIYRGNTLFVREDYRHLINPSDIPGFADKIYPEIRGKVEK